MSFILGYMENIRHFNIFNIFTIQLHIHICHDLNDSNPNLIDFSCLNDKKISLASTTSAKNK